MLSQRKRTEKARACFRSKQNGNRETRRFTNNKWMRERRERNLTQEVIVIVKLTDLPNTYEREKREYIHVQKVMVATKLDDAPNKKVTLGKRGSALKLRKP